MINNRKLLVAFLFFMTLTLLLRDTPYLNVFIINKLWIVYVLVIGVIAFFFIPRKEMYLKGVLFLLLFLALIVTLIRVMIVPEAIGIVIYLLLWFIVIQKIFVLIRGKEE